MATVLDIGLLQQFNIIFPVLLVFSIVFAILQKTKAIGESTSINAIVSIAAAFMVILSDTVVDLINFMVPWFTITLIFFILMILIFQLFGATDLSSAIKDKTLQWVIIGIGIIILVAAFGKVAGQAITEQSFGKDVAINASTTDVSTSDFETNIYSTLFHPKVLGLLVLFGIAFFAIILLSG